MGLLMSFIRMCLDFAYPAPPCGVSDIRPGVVKNFHYMYFAIVIFWATTLTTIVISLLTDPPSDTKLIRLVYSFWSLNYFIHSSSFYPSIHPSINSFIPSSIHPSLHQSIHPSMRSSIYSFIHLLIHSFIYSFIPLCFQNHVLVALR